MGQLILLDVAPDVSTSVGVLLAVILFVIGFIVLLAGGLVVLLWYRKRGLRGVEMIRSDTVPTEGAQPSNPNKKHSRSRPGETTSDSQDDALTINLNTFLTTELTID